VLRSAITSLLALMCLSVMFTGVAPAAESTDAGYRKLESFLKDTTGFEAQFTQVQRDHSGKVIDRSSGTLSLQRPNRFRWDYREPHPQVIVADGSRIWLYDPDLEQVTVRKFDTSLAATPAMLLSGEGNIRDNFKLEHAEQKGNSVWLTFSPKRSDTDFKSVKLGFDGDTLRVLELADKLGQTTEVEFEQVKRNPTFDAGRFVFTPPPGVDVIGETGAKPTP
jgi:outer membrane lipoprotein carrier protein